MDWTSDDGNVVLYQRENAVKGTYHYRIRHESIPGEYERKSTKTKVLEDAIAFAKQRYDEIRFAQKIGYSAFSTDFVKVAEKYLEWLNQQDTLGFLRKTRLKNDTDYLRKFIIPTFTGWKLQDINDAVLLNYHEERAKAWEAAKGTTSIVIDKNNKRRKFSNAIIRKPGPQSINYINRIIKNIFDFAVMKKIINRNEVPSLTFAKVENNKRGSFSAEDCKAMESYLIERIKDKHSQQQPETLHYRKVFLYYIRFLRYTGIRVGEARFVQWNHIEYKEIKGNKHIILAINNGKTGSRIVVCQPQVYECLEALKQIHPQITLEDRFKSTKNTAYLWVNIEGKHINSFSNQFDRMKNKLKIGKTAKGEDRSLYSFRHTYATERLMDGVDVSILAKNMGTSVQMISSNYEDIIMQRVAHKITGQQEKKDEETPAEVLDVIERMFG